MAKAHFAANIGGKPIDIVSGPIHVRNMAEEDLPLMLKWLSDDRVLQFYGGRDVHYTFETLKEHYTEAWDTSYYRTIIEFNGVPIGYGQIYQLDDKLFDEYQYPKSRQAVFAMDQFIGEPVYWNRGIGTAYLETILAYLTAEERANAVILDPHKDNARAIQAYTKAGFRIIGELLQHELFEGHHVDCWLMEFRATPMSV